MKKFMQDYVDVVFVNYILPLCRRYITGTMRPYGEDVVVDIYLTADEPDLKIGNQIKVRFTGDIVGRCLKGELEELYQD